MIFTSHVHFWHHISLAFPQKTFVDSLVSVPTLAAWPLSFPYDVIATIAEDTTPWVPEYHWYLHQRTDDPAKQYLRLQSAESDYPDPAVSHSGHVQIIPTTLGNDHASSPYSEDDIWRLFDMVTLYCWKIDNTHVQAIRPIKRLVGSEV